MSTASAVFWGPTLAGFSLIYLLSLGPIRVGPKPSDVGFVIHPTINNVLIADSALYGLVLVSAVGTLFCVHEVDNLRTKVKALTSHQTRSWFAWARHFGRTELCIAIIVPFGASSLIVFSSALYPVPGNYVLSLLSVLIGALSLVPATIAATFIGLLFVTLVTSIKTISSKLGPSLTLAPFPSDPRLGLGPFAKTAFRLLLAYELLILAITWAFLSITLLTGETLTNIPFQLGTFIELGTAGLVFLIPQIRIHNILVSTRRKHLSVINAERSRILKPFTETNLVQTDVVTGQQLQTLAGAEELVRRIPSWPFDARLLVKVGLSLVALGLGWFLQQGGIWTVWGLLSRFFAG